jgi:hypothetical protein
VLKVIVRICQIAFFGLGAIALAYWLGWGFGGGKSRRPLDPFQRVLAEGAVREVVDALPRREDVRKVIVGPVAGDFDGRVNEMLANAVNDAGIYDVVTWEEALAFFAKDGKTLPGPDLFRESPAARAEVAKTTGTDGWIQGNVVRSSGRRGLGASVDLAVRLVKLPDLAEIPDGEVRSTKKIETRASLDYFAPWMEQVHPLWRLFLWILFTGGLPFAAFPVVQAITARESNRWNAALLGGLVLLDVSFAAALLGFRPGWFGALALTAAACAGFVYDFAICNKIDEMRR